MAWSSKSVVLLHHRLEVALILPQVDVLDREYELTRGPLLDQGIFGIFMVGSQDFEVEGLAV